MQNLNFALIGLGYFGKNYARLLQELEGVNFKTVATRSPEAFEKYSGILPDFVKKSTDAKEIFEDPEIDCVVIATPASSHFELAKKALEKGKHVLLEKPMVLSVAEAEALGKAVEKSSRTFMVGHQYLYNDYVRHLKNEVEKGIFGNIYYVFAEHLYSGLIRKDVGCFWETATHELAIIDYLFSPKGVRGARGKMVRFSGNERDDFSSVWVDFDGAPSAGIVVSWIYPEKVRKFAVIGEKRSAVLDELREEKLKIYSGDKILVPEISAGEPLRNELEYFIGRVRDGNEPLTGIKHGMKITGFLDEISRRLN